MQQFVATLKLIRIVNCLLAGVGVYIGARMTWVEPVYYGPTVAALAAFFTCAAGNVLNDLVDRDTDRVSHPGRVLVTGALSVRYAIWLGVGLNLVALILAVAVNWYVTALVAVAIGLLIAYNLKLKRLPLAGNLVVAVLSALTFITGGVAADFELTWTLPGPLVPAIFALFYHLVRELVKDAQDVEGDYAVGYRTLPLVLGVQPTLMIALSLFALLVVLTLIPVWKDWFGRVYEVIVLYIVGLPTLGLLIITWGNPTRRLLGITSQVLKVGMVLGLVALLAATQ